MTRKTQAQGAAWLVMSDFRSEGERTFDRALQTKKFRAAMYREARQAMDEGMDLKIGDIRVCLLCRHIIEGDLPDKCRICNAKRERFEGLPSRRTDLNRKREEKG